MRTKGHYEIRECSIDVLKDGGDSSLHPEQRPYPIYPSKGGLNPDFLRKIIASALPSVADIDPIPKEVTHEFGLLSLRDAYIGIHQPKNVEEADLARKRLIFDEFFYLQLGRLYQMLEGLGTQMEKDGLLDKYRKPELTAVYMKDWSNLKKISAGCVFYMNFGYFHFYTVCIFILLLLLILVLTSRHCFIPI